MRTYSPTHLHTTVDCEPSEASLEEAKFLLLSQLHATAEASAAGWLRALCAGGVSHIPLLHSHTRTYARTRAHPRTHARTHTHTHTHALSLSHTHTRTYRCNVVRDEKKAAAGDGGRGGGRDGGGGEEEGEEGEEGGESGNSATGMPAGDSTEDSEAARRAQKELEMEAEEAAKWAHIAQRWQTRLFAIECVRRLLAVLQHGAHFDLSLPATPSDPPERLIDQLPDLVSVAFTAANFPLESVRPAGIATILDLVHKFGAAEDPEYEGHLLLELHAAQVSHTAHVHAYAIAVLILILTHLIHSPTSLTHPPHSLTCHLRRSDLRIAPTVLRAISRPRPYRRWLCRNVALPARGWLGGKPDPNPNLDAGPWPWPRPEP